MKTYLFGLLKFSGFIAGLLLLSNCSGTGDPSGLPTSPDYPVEFSLTESELMDKIKGGWAGQTIGCTYGGPTEFKFRGTMIQDYTPIAWDDTRMEWYYTNSPGLYDDIYMDLTFVEVIDKEDIEHRHSLLQHYKFPSIPSIS